MNTKTILSFFLAILLTWTGSLSVAQASVGANPNDYTKKIMFSRFDKVKDDLYYASKTTGMDMGDLTALASIEADLVSNSKNKHSTASGMLQHTKGTWAIDRKAYHKQVGIPATAKATDPKASLAIGAAGLMDSKRFLAEKTHLTESTVRLGDLYMTHFLGRDAAARVINSNSNTPISKYVRISKGNYSLFVNKNGKVRTTREFRQYLDTIVKREKAFYSNQVTHYANIKERKENQDRFLGVGDEILMAQANTSKYIGWGS